MQRLLSMTAVVAIFNYREEDGICLNDELHLYLRWFAVRSLDTAQWKSD